MKKLIVFVRCVLVCAWFFAACNTISNAQEIRNEEFTTFVQLRGKVVDEKGNGISDVIILINGTSRGVVSQKDGNFEIPVPEGQPFGLYCWHPKYIIKNYPVDNTSLDRKITLVLKKVNAQLILIGSLLVVLLMKSIKISLFQK